MGRILRELIELAEHADAEPVDALHDAAHRTEFHRGHVGIGIEQCIALTSLT